MKNSGLIALKASSGQPLTATERAQLPPRLLAQLASGNHIKLTREERDRMANGPLALLVSGRKAVLDPGEIDRFDMTMRFIIESSLKIGKRQALPC